MDAPCLATSERLLMVRGLETFKTLDRAIEAAVARLAREGHTVDLQPGSYRLPAGARRETG